VPAGLIRSWRGAGHDPGRWRRGLRAAAACALLAWPAWREAGLLPLPVEPPSRLRFETGLTPGPAFVAPPLPAAPGAAQREAVAATMPRWATLLHAAQQDDPVAACRLAVLLDDCRMADDIGAMIETRISMAARAGDGLREAAAEIEELEASAEPLRASCADAPPALVAQGWNFLLRAAIAGHEPSMYRFVTDPPLAAQAPAEARAALAAWRQHARVLLVGLLRRASPQALPLAYRAAQGEPLVADLPLQPRDPAAVLRLGSALAMLLEDDANRASELETAALELPPAVQRQARREGAQLARSVTDRAIRQRRMRCRMAGDGECLDRLRVLKAG